MLPLPFQNLAEGGVQPNPLQVVLFIEALLTELIHFPMMLPAERFHQLSQVMNFSAVTSHANPLHFVYLSLLSANSTAPVRHAGIDISLDVLTLL